MTPDPISADLKTVLRRLKLSRLLDTLPERLTLARRYGDARVNAACDTALAAEMLSVRRLARLLELATPPPAVPPARVLPLARYLRPATHYALPLATPEQRPEGDPA